MLAISIPSLLSLLFLLSLIKKALADCSEGCLKCKSSLCEVCDPFRNFVLENANCQQQSINNCLMSFQPGVCSLCDFGYYLTPDFKCAQVPLRSKASIFSCNNYFTISSCLVCDFYTYERNGLCRPIKKQIPYCTKYANPDECEICNLRLPSASRLSCDPIPDNQNNCLFFRHPLSCTACAPGYKMEPNYLLKNLNNTDLLSAFFLQLDFWRDSYFNIVFNTPVCVFENSIKHCDSQDTSFTCLVCSSGYSLSSDRSQCFQTPQPPEDPSNRIPNCYKFATQNYEVCQMCIETFLLQDSNTRCKKHTKTVPNCSVHSQTTDSTCVFCDNKYFLNITETNATLSCVLRTNFLLNCKTYHRTKDICLECLAGHLFHFNKTRCSPVIPNCQSHNITGRVLTCIDCLDTHYLNQFNTSCIDALGATEGCQKYGKNSICLVCKQFYYLDLATNKCFVQDKFSGCLLLSVTVKAECSVCSEQGTRTQQIDQCTTVGLFSLVNDCLQYDQNQACILCKQGKVPVFSSGKYSCTDFIGCNQSTSTTDASFCASCYSPYFLYNGLCLKPDTANCVFSLSQNTTFYLSQISFVDAIPCEVCDSGMYYTTLPGQRDQRCITADLGQNCLNFYSTDENFLLSGSCNECRRGFKKNLASPLNCIANDVLPPYSGTLVANQIRARSANATWSFNATELNAATMFPDRTFSTGTATNPTASTICLQVNSDQNRCLSCKWQYCTKYSASAFSDFKNTANFYSHTSFPFAESSIKAEYERRFNDSSYPVTDCFSCSSADTSLYPKEARIAVINGVNHYYCRWAHDTSKWTIDDVNMAMKITIGSSSVPTGYVFGTAASYTSSCFYDLSTTVPTVANCATNFNNTNLTLPFEHRVHLASCQVCKSGYILSFAIYSATVFQSAAQKASFNWVLNECTLHSTPASYFVLDNCFYYQKIYKNGQMSYECKACNPGSAPVYGPGPYYCPSTDPHYNLVNEDHCATGYHCDRHLYCRPTCSPECTSDEYCSQAGSCVLKICAYCASNPSNTDCTDSLDGCPESQYCELGQCKNKCTCQFGEQCDKTTNWYCIPFVCGVYASMNLTKLIATIPALKAAKVDQLLAAQEADYLSANQTAALQAASDAASLVTVIQQASSAADSAYTTAQTYLTAIQANPIASASDISSAQALLSDCLTAKNNANTAYSSAQTQLTTADQAAANANSATTSTDAEPYMQAAQQALSNISTLQVTATNSKNTAIAKRDALNTDKAALDSELALANTYRQTALDKSLIVFNDYENTLSTFADMVTAYATLDFITTNALMTTISGYSSDAQTANTAAAAADTSATALVPGTTYATDTHTYAQYAAANYTLLVSKANTATALNEAARTYQYSLTTLTAYSTAQTAFSSATSAYTNKDSVTLSVAFDSLTTQKSTSNAAAASALTSKNLAVSSASSSSYATDAATFLGYANANDTLINGFYTDTQLMTYALQAYTYSSQVSASASSISSYKSSAVSTFSGINLSDAGTGVNALNTEKTNAIGYATNADALVSGISSNTASAVTAAANAQALSSTSSYTSDANSYATIASGAKTTALSDVTDIDNISLAIRITIYQGYTYTNKTGACTAKDNAVNAATNADKTLYADQANAYYAQAVSSYNALVSLKASTNCASTTSPAWCAQITNAQSAGLTNENDAQTCSNLADAQRGTGSRLLRLLFTKEEFEAQVDAMYWGPGCDLGYFCFQSSCQAVVGCPVCDKDKYCTRLADGLGGYDYSCTADSYCLNNCKPAGKYCWGSVSSGSNQAVSCQTTPQRALVSSTCSPACSASQVCVDSVCTKSFQDACYFALNNSVPVYCGTDEFCQNGVCIKNCQPKCETGFTCNNAQNKCVEDAYVAAPIIIRSCKAVANCLTDYTNTALNACSGCADGFGYLAILVSGSGGQVKQVSNDTCVDTGVPRCKVALEDAQNPGTYLCDSCLPGYTLKDGVCNPNVSNCKAFNETNSCRWCSDIYGTSTTPEDRVFMNGIFESGSCTTYPTATAKVTPNSDTDANCLYFQYYYTTAPLKPAAISAGINVCSICKTGFFLTGSKKCLPTSITNCATYDPASTAASITCQTCNVGYTLSVDKKSCADNTPTDPKYFIPQCSHYGFNNNCAQCAPGFMLGTVGANDFGQVTYCFSASPTDINCQSLNTMRFAQDGKLQCSICRTIDGSFAFPLVLDSPIKTCLGIAQKVNCIAQNSGLFTLNYKCTNCTAGYFLTQETNICTLRQSFPIDNCVVYDILQDQCAQFLAEAQVVASNDDPLPLDVQKLLASPPVNTTEVNVDFKNWIMACRTYNDSNTCQDCYPPKYLDPSGFEVNNKCKVVSKVVPHCANYSDSVTCVACDDFYLLVEGQCLLKTVERCQEYDGPNACRSCPPSHPLLDDEGNCSNDPENPDCFLYNVEDPTQTSFDCDTCMEGFFPNEVGICTKVSTPIEQCQFYSSEKLCKTCNKYYYLSYDRKSCKVNPDFDPYCVDYTQKTECAVCNFGYFLQNSTCVKCGAIGEGCAFCDPEAPDKCIMCTFGYNMVGNGTCALGAGVTPNQTFVRQFHYMNESEQILKQAQSGVSALAKGIVRMWVWAAWMLVICAFEIFRS